MADTKKYIYICDKKHQIASDTPLDKCLAYTHGKPCTGKLKSVGAGSRTKNA